MSKLKKLVIFTLLITALMLPTSAFASTGKSSVRTNNSSSYHQIFSFFFGNKDDEDHSAQFWKQYSDDQNKDCGPDGESIDIWRKWFCY